MWLNVCFDFLVSVTSMLDIYTLKSDILSETAYLSLNEQEPDYRIALHDSNVSIRAGIN